MPKTNRWGYIEETEEDSQRKLRRQESLANTSSHSSYSSNGNNSTASDEKKTAKKEKETLEELNRRKKKKLELEWLRAKKWADMITHYDKWIAKKEKKVGKRIMVKGLPDCLRSEAWKKMSGCSNTKKASPTLYEVIPNLSTLIVNAIYIRSISTLA